MRRYLERLRDLWQNGDIEGPIGRYIESSAAELSDFMEELNAFKVPPPPHLDFYPPPPRARVAAVPLTAAARPPPQVQIVGPGLCVL